MKRYFCTMGNERINIDTLESEDYTVEKLALQIRDHENYEYINVACDNLGIQPEYRNGGIFTHVHGGMKYVVYYYCSDYYKLTKYSYESNDTLIRYIGNTLFVYFREYLYKLNYDTDYLQDYYKRIIVYGINKEKLLLEMINGYFFEIHDGAVWQIDTKLHSGEAMPIQRAKQLVLLG